MYESILTVGHVPLHCIHMMFLSDKFAFPVTTDQMQHKFPTQTWNNKWALEFGREWLCNPYIIVIMFFYVIKRNQLLVVYTTKSLGLLAMLLVPFLCSVCQICFQMCGNRHWCLTLMIFLLFRCESLMLNLLVI